MPLLGDLKPFGRYVMSDVDRVGGVPVVMKALLDAGLLHGDCMTVTGQTVAENLAELEPSDPDGKILHAVGSGARQSRRDHRSVGLVVPAGAVVKSAGVAVNVFEGTARVFEQEQSAMAALEDGTIQAGDVVIIRYEGPKRRPRDARDAHDHRRDQRRGTRQDVMLITDGRFSGDHRTVRRARCAGGGRRRADRFRPRR